MIDHQHARRRTGIAASIAAATVIAALASPALHGQNGARVRNERYRGLVSPSREVELMAPLEEILQEIIVKEGDRVTTGQLLARLDDRLQTVVVEAARLRAQSDAEVRLAAVDLEEARENQQRIDSAFSQGAASDVEQRRARTLAARAEAVHLQAEENRALAEVNLKLEQRRLDRYQITAPFDGIIVRVVAETGALLTSQDPIFVLADHDTLEARVDLPAELYGELTLGRTYTLLAEAPVNRELHGTLQNVDPLIDTASRTFRCQFTIANEGAKLPAGFTVFLAWPPVDDGVMTVNSPTDGAEVGLPDR